MNSKLNKLVLGSNIFAFLSKKESVELLNNAYDFGITKIDTADVYGKGCSERYIGSFLNKKNRASIKIFTKAGTTFVDEANGLYTKNTIEKRLILSLKRLKTDYVDLYQLHNYDQITPLDEIFHCLENLKRKGMILEYGVSNFTKKHMRITKKYIDYKKIYSNQVHLNIFNNSHLELSKYTRIIAYGIMARGLFRDNPKESIRATNSLSVKNDLNSKSFQLIHKVLSTYSKKLDIKISDLVINYALENKKVYLAVIGFRNNTQLKDTVEATKINFPINFYDKIISDLSRISIDKETFLGKFI